MAFGQGENEIRDGRGVLALGNGQVETRIGREKDKAGGFDKSTSMAELNIVERFTSVISDLRSLSSFRTDGMRVAGRGFMCIYIFGKNK